MFNTWNNVYKFVLCFFSLWILTAFVSPVAAQTGSEVWNEVVAEKKLKSLCRCPANLSVVAVATNAFHEFENDAIGDRVRLDKEYRYNAWLLDGSLKLDLRASNSDSKPVLASVAKYLRDADESMVYDPSPVPEFDTFGRVHLGRNGSEHLFRLGYYFLEMEDTTGYRFLHAVLLVRDKWTTGFDDLGRAWIKMPYLASRDGQVLGVRTLHFDAAANFALVSDERVIQNSDNSEVLFSRKIEIEYRAGLLPKKLTDVSKIKGDPEHSGKSIHNAFTTTVSEWNVDTVRESDLAFIFPKNAVVSDNIANLTYRADGSGGRLPGYTAQKR
ncbi:hypothetical protein FB106_12716 [Synechococcus sp. Ace-Pa]|uniref:hypothetical protein n=1 Tax=Synechococcus sp. Ace-Pa TaxID=2572902 RepID=UPI0011A8670D|nr:hypothetical protein [Synechococcus sp. Ace-Pa]TWB87055.1 hypothetical protein FB106_12716 [Synechococcus sp. Ace-Pa]